MKIDDRENQLQRGTDTALFFSLNHVSNSEDPLFKYFTKAEPI